MGWRMGNKKTASKRKVSLFQQSSRLVKTINRTIMALHEGLWLGITNKQELMEITSRKYSNTTTYAGEAYNLSGLYDWEKKAIAEYFQECETILVGAAGGGREMIGLSEMGFQVDGFDSNQDLVSIMKKMVQEKDMKSEVKTALPDHVPETFGKYDGLIMGWAGYSHIQGIENRITFLKELRAHTHPGCPLLISFVDSDENPAYMKISYQIARIIRAIRFSKEKIELGDTLKELFLHHTCEDEIRRELGQSGFRLVRYSEEDFSHAIAYAD